MDAKTLEALKGSVKKWEAIVAGTGEDQGWANCPLCLMFLVRPATAEEVASGEATMINGVGYMSNERSNPCAGCPVSVATGEPYCDETPYGDGLDPDRDKRMLAFLVDLLPPEPAT